MANNEPIEKKTETVAKTIAKNGGGALAGGILGATVLAPIATWGLGIVLAPFTGGASLVAAGAITAASVGIGVYAGHKAANKE